MTDSLSVDENALTEEENVEMFEYIAKQIEKELQEGEYFTLLELARKTGIVKSRILYKFMLISNPSEAQRMKNCWCGWQSIDLSNKEFAQLYAVVKEIYNRENGQQNIEKSATSPTFEQTVPEEFCSKCNNTSHQMAHSPLEEYEELCADCYAIELERFKKASEAYNKYLHY